MNNANESKRPGTVKSSRSMRNRMIAAAAALAIAAPTAAVWLPAADAHAAANQRWTVAPRPFTIEGKALNLPTANVNGDTYIGIRALNDGLGLETGWSQATRTATISGRDRTFVVNMTSGRYALNGQTVYGPAPLLQDGAAYMPLRFLLERMGYAISYDAATRGIGISAIQENKLAIATQSIRSSMSGQSILVHYPQITGYADAAVQTKINDYLRKEAEAKVAAAKTTLAKAAKENAEAEQANPDFDIPPVSYDGSYTVTYNEDGRLSLYVDYYTYLGGAHGGTERSPYTFDLATGDVLTLKQASGGADDYLDIINAAIRKQLGERSMLLFEPFEDIKADRPYFLKHGALVIYFKEYEYTAYAEGMPEFAVPFGAFK